MSPVHAHRLKYVLFDLAVVATVVAAACLGGRAFGTAPPPAPERAARGGAGTGLPPAPERAESECHAIDVARSARNRRQRHELRQRKSAVVDERNQLQEEMVAGPWIGDEDADDIADEIARAVTDAETHLMEIELSERVLELERLGWPLHDGMKELRVSVEGAGFLEGAALVQRHLHAHAARLNAFRAEAKKCHALDARLAGRGGDVEGGYREMLDNADRLNETFEDLWRAFEETRRAARSVQDALVRLTDEL